MYRIFLYYKLKQGFKTTYCKHKGHITFFNTSWVRLFEHFDTFEDLICSAVCSKCWYVQKVLPGMYKNVCTFHVLVHKTTSEIRWFYTYKTSICWWQNLSAWNYLSDDIFMWSFSKSSHKNIIIGVIPVTVVSLSLKGIFHLYNELEFYELQTMKIAAGQYMIKIYWRYQLPR